MELEEIETLNPVKEAKARARIAETLKSLKDTSSSKNSKEKTKQLKPTTKPLRKSTPYKFTNDKFINKS